MARTRSGCVRFHSSPQLPCSRPASMSCVPMAPSPSSGRSRAASCSVFLGVKCIVDCFQNEAPFVFTAGRIAVTARGTIGVLPGQNIVQRLSQQRLFALNRGHQRHRILQILAHGFMTVVTRCGAASLFSNEITVLARFQRNVVMKGQWPSQVGAGGAVITKMRVNGMVFEPLDGKPLRRPSLEGFPVHRS